MPALTVHNAEIKTAAVEIRTLTISGKQVTLAVFRQLIETRLVNEDGTLAGLPWGTINYHPDRCADDGIHLHVVWQDDTELRRSKVPKPRWQKEFWTDLADVFFQREFCAREHRWPDYARPVRLMGDKEESPTFPIDGFVVAANPPTSPSGYWRAHYDPKHKCGDIDDPSRANLLKELSAEVADEKTRRDRLNSRWRELTDLPQLFIAV